MEKNNISKCDHSIKTARHAIFLIIISGNTELQHVFDNNKGVKACAITDPELPSAPKYCDSSLFIRKKYYDEHQVRHIFMKFFI